MARTVPWIASNIVVPQWREFVKRHLLAASAVPPGGKEKDGGPAGKPPSWIVESIAVARSLGPNAYFAAGFSGTWCSIFLAAAAWSNFGAAAAPAQHSFGRLAV
jgi:hypothetical protein